MLPAVSSGGKLNDNPVLDANLACISKYNPNLKYKIMKEKTLSTSSTLLCHNKHSVHATKAIRIRHLSYSDTYLQNIIQSFTI